MRAQQATVAEGVRHGLQIGPLILVDVLVLCGTHATSMVCKAHQA